MNLTPALQNDYGLINMIAWCDKATALTVGGKWPANALTAAHDLC
jgi:hypothetical protein